MASSASLVAVITGGGTGFGREMAHWLHREVDATVILVGRRPEPLQQVKAELNKGDRGACHTITGDVASLDTWKAIRTKIETECGGKLHFLGNNAAAPDPGKPWDELDDPQRQIIDFNTVNISSVQLGYHALVPLLAAGAAKRGKPSIVLNLSSCASVNPRAFAHQLPTYTPSKCAVDAITRCAYGLYKDQNILSYGINPVAYDTPILTLACKNLHLDSPSVLAERYNPFPVLGDARHMGELAVALLKDPSRLESGCSYNMLPLTPELSSSSSSDAAEKDSTSRSSHGPQSLLLSIDYAAAYLHSTDMLAQLRGWANVTEAYDQTGRKLSDEQLDRIRAALKAKIVDSSM